ncbi:MAG: hypothetical protein R3A52_31165 [Polyangiales bacterium]
MEIWERERDRVLLGAVEGEDHDGWMIGPVTVTCDGDAAAVLDRCRAVMAVMLPWPRETWPTPEAWETLLPAWFVEACAAPSASGELCTPWPLGAWTGVFAEDWRPWFWWDARVLSDDVFELEIAIDGFPFGEAAMRWLLVAAGARSAEGTLEF